MAAADYSEFHGIRALNAIDALCIAAATSHLKEMRLLLADGVDINGIAIYSNMTPLCGAARLGATRSVAMLIEHGASVDLPSFGGTTPLMFACSRGKKKGFQIAQQLIAAGADVNFVGVGEGTALKAAMDGFSPEIIQLLIDHGAEIDGPPGTFQTALMLAARNDDVATIKLLLDNGADRTLTCKLPWAENRTAQGLAELEGRRKAAAYFKKLAAEQK
jgi:ankyrin repeat protein